MTQAINTPQHMFLLIKNWHEQAVADAKHLYNVDHDGTVKVSYTEEDGTIKEVVLDDTNIIAFFAAATAVLSLFENLPFQMDNTVDEQQTK